MSRVTRLSKAWIACTALALSVPAQNWPVFRGPQAMGVADQATPPDKWDAPAGTNVRWKTPIPGISVSSPVVWGNRVFVTTSVSSDPKSEFRHGLYGDTEPAKDESEHTWKVYALDRDTGKIAWEQTACKGIPKNKRHPKASHSSATPATDGKRVFAWFGSEGLYAYDFSGKLVWKKDLGIVGAGWFFDPDYEWGVASSPFVYKDMVIIQADNTKQSFLAAFDTATGKELWRTKRDEISSWGTPVVHEYNGSPRLITNATNRIRAYHPATGKLVWELGNNSEITCTTPVVGDGLIYIANGYPPVRPIYAVKWEAEGDITLKEGESSSTSIAWSTKQGGSYQPSPLLHEGTLYVLQNQGILAAYDAKTGQRAYQERVAGKGGSFSASPVLAGGNLYLASEDGEVHVVKAGRKYEFVSSNPVGEVLMATPAITGDMIIVRGMKSVYAFGAPKKQATALPGRVSENPASGAAPR